MSYLIFQSLSRLEISCFIAPCVIGDNNNFEFFFFFQLYWMWMDMYCMSAWIWQLCLSIDIFACVCILCGNSNGITPYVNVRFCISSCPCCIICCILNNDVWSMCVCVAWKFVSVWPTVYWGHFWHASLVSENRQSFAVQSVICLFLGDAPSCIFSFPYPINIPHFKQTAAVLCSRVFAHFYANFWFGKFYCILFYCKCNTRTDMLTICKTITVW